MEKIVVVRIKPETARIKYLREVEGWDEKTIQDFTCCYCGGTGEVCGEVCPDCHGEGVY